jgi:hypothetical protein
VGSRTAHSHRSGFESRILKVSEVSSPAQRPSSGLRRARGIAGSMVGGGPLLMAFMRRIAQTDFFSMEGFCILCVWSVASSRGVTVTSIKHWLSPFMEGIRLILGVLMNPCRRSATPVFRFGGATVRMYGGEHLAPQSAFVPPLVI